MTEQQDPPEDETQPPGLEDPPEDDEQDQDDTWTPPTKEAWEKLNSRAERRENALRSAQAKLKELEGKKDQQNEPDPVEQANQRLVRAEARTALAAIGVSREDMAGVLEVLNLSGVEVSDDGDVDADEVEERIARLRKVFGGVKSEKPPPPRTPRTDPRDRGAGGGATDPDKARYQRILGRR